MPDTEYIAAEQGTRRDIDDQLAVAGWTLQDSDTVNLAAGDRRRLAVGVWCR